MAEPLDPAAIMAKHEIHHPVHYIDDESIDCCACSLPEFGNRSCDAYRLAAELAEARERIVRVESLCDTWTVNYTGTRGYLTEVPTLAARELRAALASEGTARTLLDRDELIDRMAAALRDAACICRSGRNQHGTWYLVDSDCPKCGDYPAKATAIFDAVFSERMSSEV